MKKNVEELELRELLRTDPASAGERYRAKLGVTLDEKLRAVTGACGEESISGALLVALQAYRRFVGFSHDLAAVTGRGIYEVRQTLGEKLGSDFLNRQLQALKHGGSWPTVEQAPFARQIIQAIRDRQPKPECPRIVNMENLTEEERQRLVDGEPTDYVSRTLSNRPDSMHYEIDERTHPRRRIPVPE